MYFVSATRLKLGSIFYLPRFMAANNASAKQLIITPGFVAGAEIMDKGLTFWTLTLWHKDADMKSFRNSPAHRKAMQKLPDWCCEATYAHWMQDEATLPDWNTVHERMVKEGIASKLRNGTERHQTKAFPIIKWRKTERKFKPITNYAKGIPLGKIRNH
ncbi:MAG TPA: hypothetical protein VN922_03295 [Bacteroidia bacterium]|nr:hypothetical protein [Bacteroidia bacterium]